MKKSITATVLAAIILSVFGTSYGFVSDRTVNVLNCPKNINKLEKQIVEEKSKQKYKDSVQTVLIVEDRIVFRNYMESEAKRDSVFTEKVLDKLDKFGLKINALLKHNKAAAKELENINKLMNGDLSENKDTIGFGFVSLKIK